MSRVLITGACGNIGQHTVALLAERGHRVRALDLPAPAYERIADSVLTEFVVTDSIPLNKEKNTDKIKVLPVHDMFAETLTCLVENRSISDTLLIH